MCIPSDYEIEKMLESTESDDLGIKCENVKTVPSDSEMEID